MSTELHRWRKAATTDEWAQLAKLAKPREKITMNRWQMHIAGLLQQVEGKS
ncbi:hypothetical protein ABLY41_000286 [Enterobacter roggenkampii]